MCYVCQVSYPLLPISVEKMESRALKLYMENIRYCLRYVNDISQEVEALTKHICSVDNNIKLLENV